MSKIVVLVLIALALGPSQAVADYVAGSFQQAQTRFGLLQVVGQRGQQRVLFNGADLGLETYAYSIDGVWGAQGGTQDWAILTARHGGNMCGGASQIAIMLTNGAAARTDEFGVCRGRPIDLRVTATAVEIDISDPAPRVAHRVFRFDGVNLAETPVALAAAARIPGGGTDVTRWLSQFPQALTEDAGEQARFARILTPSQMDELNARLSDPGKMERKGDWVIGRGCQAHACNASYGLWALRVSDGTPLAIFRNSVAGSDFDRQTVFGGEVAQTDRTALDIIMEIAP